MDIVGKKFYAFEFSQNDGIFWNEDYMRDMIGVVLTIDKVESRRPRVYVKYKNTTWCYPIQGVLENLVEEEDLELIEVL